MSDSKRFVLMTYGSRGDVEPFVALARGLRQAGHDVRLMAPAPFAHLAFAHGVNFEPLEGNPEELALALTDRAGLNGPRMVKRMIEHVLPLAERVARAALRTAREAEVIVHSFLLTDAGHTIAVRQGIPDFSAQLFPVFATTGDFPAPVFPDWRWGGTYRRFTHRLSTAVFRFGGRLLYRRIRSGAPDLPDLAPWPFNHSSRGPTPLLFAYSPAVLPRPYDWPPHTHVTGYWKLPPPSNWSPPDDLRRFLDEGQPPVFFGVGSMRTQRMRQLLEGVLQAIRSTDHRAIIGGPGREVHSLTMPQGVYALEWAPYDWLFPQMAMIVHHGGAGTTGAALRSGVPSVAIPFTADQAFWARRAHQLGVGPAGVPVNRLTTPVLDRLIRETKADPSFVSRAQSVAEQLRHEDGVATALSVIDAHLRAFRPAA